MGQISINNVLLNRFEDLLMMALEIYKKFVNAFGENADPAQPAHVGFDMDRINPLLIGVDFKDIGETACS